MRRDCAAELSGNSTEDPPLGKPPEAVRMRCPSCGAISENADCCAQLGLEATENQALNINTANDPNHGRNMNSASDLPTQPEVRKSTLIEFPGVNRTPVPEWRKELSERVREVQERRAREAAREALEIEQKRIEDSVLPPQLELLPPADVPAMNPLVAAALKRIERAHQTTVSETRQTRNNLATAVAYAPAREESEQEVLAPVLAPQLAVQPESEAQHSFEAEATPHIEKSHLTVVPALDEAQPELKQPEAAPIPKRLIVDDPNDPALNYLDSISRNVRVDEIATRRPAAFRRLVCALLDLVVCGLLCAPIAFAMRMTGTDPQDPRAIQVLVGCLVVITFIYLTLTTALTGRTWAMRLLSLRVIDTKTGLIPTGSQSVGRSFLYLISLALAGLGILFALVSRDGYTVHDRFTRTAVIGT